MCLAVRYCTVVYVMILNSIELRATWETCTPTGIQLRHGNCPDPMKGRFGHRYDDNSSVECAKTVKISPPSDKTRKLVSFRPLTTTMGSVPGLQKRDFCFVPILRILVTLH